MGDSVERALEETVPLLRSIRKGRLLSRAEVQEVVRKRRDHEYRLQNREAPLKAYLHYVNFEQELTSLIRKRADARNMKRTRRDVIVGRSSARVNLVYSRAVKRYKGDVKLWMKYAKHCIQSGSSRAAAKVFARAIAMRPDSETVWVNAVAFHFDTCGDVGIARTLAQRALRTLGDSKIMWKEYFRMELAFVAKLIARRVSIGIAVNGTQSSTTTVSQGGNVAGEVDEPQAETVLKDGGTEPMDSSQDSAQQPKSFWEGGVPLAIFRQAERKLEMSVQEKLDYWQIVSSMRYAPPQLVADMVQQIAVNDGSHCAVRAIQARMNFDVALGLCLQSAKEKPIGDVAQSLSQAAGSDASRSEPHEKVQQKALEARDALISLLKAEQGLETSEAESVLTIASQFGKVSEPYLTGEQRENLLDELRAFSITSKRHDSDNVNVPLSGLSVSAVANDGSYTSWCALLSSVASDATERRAEIREALKRTVAVPFRSEEQGRVALLWISWETSLSTLATALRALLEVPPVSAKLLKAAIQAYYKLLDANEGASPQEEYIEQLRNLFSKLSDLDAVKSDIDFWVDNVEFERERAWDSKRTEAVMWKARKVLSRTNAEIFAERLCLRSLRR